VRIRTVKTASGNFAVQVVSKRKGKLTVHKHIGSYKTDGEKSQLLFEANSFINTHDTFQEYLFRDKEVPFESSDIKITKSQPLFLYTLLCTVYDQLGFDKCADPLIRDLIVARVYRPVSKRETVEVLRDSFGKNYSLKTVYRHLKTAIDEDLKDQFQTALVNFAKEELNDSLRLVFYDVTTLAFDSQARLGLKDFGFSKDHRFQDVQIVVGLVVNRDGFPLYFDVFNGKTFEGKTFLSVVLKIKVLLKNPNLIVIADAAMISKINVTDLDEQGIGFIVGARLGSAPTKLQEQISNETGAKDRSDREKQVKKAEVAISSPAKISQRFRFIQTINGKYEVNTALIEKAKRLEGIKGYLTNTELSEIEVIDHYHNLWKIEKAFKVTKSDLEARPIFLRLDKTITAHLIIVFASLAICKYLEIKTNMSIQKILKIAQKVLTHKVTMTKTGESHLIETTIEDPDLCGQLEKLRLLGH